jgi:hypothetical protein
LTDTVARWVSEALYALLDMLLDGDSQRVDSAATLSSVGGAVPGGLSRD